jgi:glucose/arabinose dehydrogenase
VLFLQGREQRKLFVTIRKRTLTACLTVIIVLLSSRTLWSQSVTLEPVLSGLSSPVYVTNAHDGSQRLFIVERDGRIKVLQPGATVPTIFLDITTQVLAGGERGLLGLTFHPRFASNRRFFVNYTRTPDGATVIAEYRASAINPNVAETNESILLTIVQPFANHNGGMIEFGPDGFLYIGMGDGGSANDPDNRAQNTQDLLGKILRIDVGNPQAPYTSPSTNPFFGSDPGRDEIFAVGLRNPWRFSFDRDTGQLYTADVGQGEREEIDIVTLGGNYGWRVFEGTRCTNLGPASCSASGLTPPIAEYSHTGGRCSITGGYVYHGNAFSLPSGTYVYGDYCTGEIFLLDNGQQRLLLDTNLNLSSFGEDEAGEIYVVGLGGTVHRLANPSVPPESVAIKAEMETPTGGQPVAGIAQIRGWAFATQAGVQIDQVTLLIDGVPTDVLLCCSGRGDVLRAFPDFPVENTLNSGWGATFNWGLLSAGPHTVQAQVGSTSGALFSTPSRMVTVVKPADAEFLDMFDVSGATTRIEGQDIIVEGVAVRDKATQQRKVIDIRMRWFENSQSPEIVATE